MARGSCRVGSKKPIAAADTFKGSGRNRGRTCVKVGLEHGRPDRKGKRGKGRLVDSGVRFVGCFGSAKKAEAVRKSWDRKKAVC